MKILVTGFDPFGGEAINPSMEAVLALPSKIGDATLIKVILPTKFREAGEILMREIEAHQPDAVVSIGQAGGRSAITPERVAVNLRDASIPDNGGVQPTDETIFPEAPTAYFATLPIKKIVATLKEAGIPAAISNTAGTFVCNEVMYTVLHEAAQKRPAMTAGFIHIPFTEEQAAKKPEGTPFLTKEVILQGIITALKVVSMEQ